MLIFGLNLSSRRKKRFPGIDDVIVARPCHWSTSADCFVDMTLKQLLSRDRGRVGISGIYHSNQLGKLFHMNPTCIFSEPSL